MFEKEAKEYRAKRKDCQYFSEPYKNKIEKAFKDGAEFGYNEANEWQYDTPDTGKDLLCQTAPDEFEVGYYHPKDERFYTLDGKAIDVIAWKEIVMPKEAE